MTATNDLRRSSLYERARNSFFRSKGDRGADVETLRGNTGADFEGEAIVTRGNKEGCSGLGIFFCLPRNKASKKKYVLIKGPEIFVFSKVTSSAPKYAIPLKQETVQVYDSRGNNQVVELKTGLGDIEYKFKFDLTDNGNIGDRFGSVLQEQINVGNNEEIKKKLGHPSQCNSKSVRYAIAIAEKKKEDQPKVEDGVNLDGAFNAATLEGYAM